jgi:MFS family permease
MFFGWWIVIASFFIALYVGGVIFYGFTAIFEPIAGEMGWSYTQISLAASIRGAEMGLLAPLIGVLADRWGPRRLIFSGAIIIAMGLILSYATSLGMFYGAFILIAIGMSGCTITVLLTAVANWFRRRVGLASGIAISGFGFGGLLIPLTVRLIELYDWRLAMTILALGMLVMIPPLSFLFRHKPEQYGYLPDGQAEDSVTFDNGAGLSPTVEVSIKGRQALKSSSFWHIALAFVGYAIVVTATITHVMPYLSSIGITRSISSLVATAMPLTSIGGRLSFGWLGDRLDRRRIAAGGFALMSLGMLCFSYISSIGIWLLVPFIILFGIGYGGSNVLRASLTREYFGRTSFGTIFGLMIGINMLGGILGPPLAGWVFDNWGSYQGIWFVFAGLSVAALISVLTIRPTRAFKPANKA